MLTLELLDRRNVMKIVIVISSIVQSIVECQ